MLVTFANASGRFWEPTAAPLKVQQVRRRPSLNILGSGDLIRSSTIEPRASTDYAVFKNTRAESFDNRRGEGWMPFCCNVQVSELRPKPTLPQLRCLLFDPARTETRAL